MKHCKYDESVMVLDPEGDRSIPRQINCKSNSAARDCSRCGWNPAVENLRRTLPLTTGNVKITHSDDNGNTTGVEYKELRFKKV